LSEALPFNAMLLDAVLGSVSVTVIRGGVRS
jgi:hypothetical protein